MRLVAEREYFAQTVVIKVALETDRSTDAGTVVPTLSSRLVTQRDVAVSFNGSWVLVSTSGDDASDNVYPADAIDSIEGLRLPDAHLY